MSHNNNNSTVKHLFSVGQSWGFGNRVCLFLCSQSFFPGLSSTGRQAYFILFIYFCVYLFYLFIYIYLIYLCIYLYILFFFFFHATKGCFVSSSVSSTTLFGRVLFSKT